VYKKKATLSHTPHTYTQADRQAARASARKNPDTHRQTDRQRA